MTSTERRRTWSERLDPRNWSLVAKLAVVGLVPTVLALTIGALQVVDQANVAEELGQGSGLVEAHQQVGSLTQALQAERAAAVTFAGGNRLGDRNAVDSAQAATDQAVTRAGETLAAAEQQAPQIATARRQADTTLGQLSVIRSQVAAPPTPAVDVTTRYTAVIQRTLALDRALLGQLQTSDTAGLASALGSTASAGEALELERSVLGGAIAGSQLDEQQKALVNGAEATYQAAASDFQAALTPAQLDRFGNFATDPANAARQNLRDTIMATPDDGRVAADAAAWNAAVDGSTAVVRAADDQAEQQFVDGRAQAAERAGNAAGLNSVLLMLGLLLTVGIILLLGRQLVRSLRVLRSSALDVAERRLPQAVQGMRAGQAPSALVEPVPLESRDEIGEVARAFDAVHGQAIRLAADQAALQQNVNSMFVNLSRRSQALVERQLQLIEQLESNEQDPDQLSNLFQLDHLATRMRRNSENLLVLAGTDLTKRNVAPVQVVDVLRAAVSEVEQYQRVVVQTPPSATIAGRAANDVVHLLAELLDNATNFSPPDSQVVMSTTRTADESLLIEISDRGVGMADSELADANQRLSGPSEVDVSASRRMGLFVVGRLAARHRVGVRLYSASGAGRTGGLSASVTVPPHLVPSSSPVVEQPPAMVGAGDGGVSASAPPTTVDVPEPVNGLVRNGAGSSTISGADGPVAPTFGSGNAGAPTRNGSAPKLPTRTPGSALRQNPGETGPGGSTNGTGAATNGSSVAGVNAFTPSGPPRAPYPDDHGTAADMFAPAPDGPSTTGGYRALPDANGSGPGRDTRWPDGGRAGRGAGHETDGGQGGSDADGPDAAVPATRTPYETDDAAATRAAAEESGSWGTHEEQESWTADEEPGTSAASVDDDETPADTDATDGTGRTVLGTAAAVGAGGVFAGLVTRPRRETDEARDGQPDEDSWPATPEGDPQHADHTAEAAADTPDAPDEPGVAADGSEAVTDTAPTATQDVNGADAPAADRAVDAGDIDEPDDAVALRSESTGAPTPSDAEPAAAQPADADNEAATTTVRELPDAPDDADTDTAAFPSLRPPREPMGGPRPAPGQARPGPLRPAPARRPVMPGGPSPASRPVGSPAAAQHTGQFPAGQAPAGRAYTGRPPAARGDQDELFAPAVPVGDERGQLRRPGGLETARSGSGYDISQTTPIFEEIASAWFRSNRSVPVRWQDNAPVDNAPAAGGAPAAPGTAGGPQRPAPSPSPAPRPTPGPGPRPSEAPVTADHAVAGEDAGFASPADEVWRQAAAGAGDADDPADELTSAGLPKRRPRARLLPGSAAGSTVLSPPSSEARSAENVRGRLASYQQGVRQGRESASGRIARGGDDDPGSGPADRPNPSDHEETT